MSKSRTDSVGRIDRVPRRAERYPSRSDQDKVKQMLRAHFDREAANTEIPVSELVKLGNKCLNRDDLSAQWIITQVDELARDGAGIELCEATQMVHCHTASSHPNDEVESPAPTNAEFGTPKPQARPLREEVKDQFWRLLVGGECQNVGKEIKWEVLINSANLLLSRKDKTQRWCGDLLRAMNKEGRHPNIYFKCADNFAVACWGERPVVDDRGWKHRQQKEQLGAVIWHAVFGVGKIDAAAYSLHLTPAFERKRQAIREKSPVTVVVDSGTTTLAVMGELLRMETMPLQVSVCSENEPENKSVRPVSLHVLTNSWPIVEKISAHKFCTDIDLTMVGGNVRCGRKSICGPLTQSCLDQWNFRGDLAIVGATGYRCDYSGRLSFACDNLEEACLKETFLGMSWLRVLVFDSSKLRSHDVSRTFAPVSDGTMDMVVTDDGVELGYEEDVKRLAQVASDEGVAVAILKTYSKNNSPQKPR